MFCVIWSYSKESKADFCLFGPFKTYEKADEWGKSRHGKVNGTFEVLKMVKPS